MSTLPAEPEAAEAALRELVISTLEVVFATFLLLWALLMLAAVVGILVLARQRRT